MTQGKPNTRAAQTASPEALERVIARAKQQLERMIDLNPLALVLLDAEGGVVRVNRAFLALIGVGSFEAVLHRPLADLLGTPMGPLLTALRNPDPAAAVHELSVGGGDAPRLLRISRVDAGTPETMVVTAEDITNEQTELALVEQAYKVEAVRALMGALMHHLNQPLTVVTLRARLLLETLERGTVAPAELKSTLEAILAAAVRVADTLRRVERTRDYRTQTYVEGLDIMDIGPVAADASQAPSKSV